MNKSTTQRKPVEVKAAMAMADITGSVLADHLGISQAAISRRLTGAVDFTTSELIHAAQLLQVEPASLLPTNTALAEERGS